MQKSGQCPPLSNMATERRLRFFGCTSHAVLLMKTITAQLLLRFASIHPSDWKRPPGRPNHTWLRAIESDLRPANIGPFYALKKAASREHCSGVRLWIWLRSRRVGHTERGVTVTLCVRQTPPRYLQPAADAQSSRRLHPAEREMGIPCMQPQRGDALRLGIEGAVAGTGGWVRGMHPQSAYNNFAREKMQPITSLLN